MRWDSLQNGDVLVALSNDRVTDYLSFYLVLYTSPGVPGDSFGTYLRLIDLAAAAETGWECDTFIGRAYAVYRGAETLKSIACLEGT